MLARKVRWAAVAKILADVMLVNLGFFLAYLMRYEWQWFRPVDEANRVPFSAYLPNSLALTGILLFIYWVEGAYGYRRKHSLFSEVWMVVRGTVTGVAAIYVFSLLQRAVLFSRLIFAYTGFTVVVLLAMARIAEKSLESQLRRRGRGVQRALIVGVGEIGRTIMRNIVAQPELGYQVVGFVDDRPERGTRDIGRFKALGSTDRILEVIKQQQVNVVIITLPWLYHRKILGIMAQCERVQVAVKIVPDLFQMSLSNVDIDDLNGIPLIGIRSAAMRGWNLAVKRGMDVLVGSLLLILFSPILIIVAALIKLDSPGQAIFKQTRVGRGGRHFTVYKFRTMREGAEFEQQALTNLNEASGPLFKIRDDPRRTKLGRFLRRTSLDELPQFYNVLRGEMSMIGPRPALPSEVEQYQPWHSKRLETWPGITGLWQVSGRSELTFDEMVLLDIYYIENWSPLLDLKIALKTIPTLILGTGAY
jgi:exopolysaccharide biosynthesis polyprenyl glycosylphosphotransferase